MIYIQDNLLTSKLYKELVNYCDEFNEVKFPDKSFWVKQLPEEFKNYIIDRLEKIEGKKNK